LARDFFESENFQMEEEDGRPGAVARKSGHLDATDGVLMESLSLPRCTRLRAVIPRNSHKIPSNPRKCHPERAQRVEGPAFFLVSINPIPRLFSGEDQPKAISPTAGGQGETP
jgi:hypothetical protein